MPKLILVYSAAITKHHSIGGLNNRNLYSTGLKSRKSKNKVSADVVPDESSLPGL